MDARAKWSEVRALDKGSLTLGPNTADRYLGDPKRIAFMLSRYKFAAKMLKRCHTIVEWGCGDGFGTLTFLADTDAQSIIGYDFDGELITYANDTLLPAARGLRPDGILEFIQADLMSDHVNGGNGVCSLDVWEHIDPARSQEFIHRLSMDCEIAVIGTPNALAAQYASTHSQVGHINMKTPDQMRAELEAKFAHVFLFSMSDEVVHTGFDKLAHYLMALCVRPL